MTEPNDDEMQVVHVEVTNPAGQMFPAVLTGHGVSKAGVVSFYVEPENAPPGEAPGDRVGPCRAFADGRPFYQVHPVTSGGSVEADPTPAKIAEAAERAAFDAWSVREGGEPTATTSWWHIHRSGPTHTKYLADAVLAAILPLVRAEEAERIAKEIEALGRRNCIAKGDHTRRAAYAEAVARARAVKP